MTVLKGHLHLRAAMRPAGRTVLAEQAFAVPFHLSKPYWDPDHDVLIVQVANPTAGILAGDCLTSNIAVDDGARLSVTTPSASRVFQMDAGEASLEQRFAVASGGWLEVMPEPLVLHRGARFIQRTAVDVVTGGGLFFVDQLVPGRVGHGEIWAWDRLALDLSVRIDGDLVLRERVAQTGGELRALAAAMGFATMAAFANAVLVDPSCDPEPAWLPTVRALDTEGLWCGATALGAGVWSLRLIAADGVSLRRGVQSLRAALATTVTALRCDLRKL